MELPRFSYQRESNMLTAHSNRSVTSNHSITDLDINTTNRIGQEILNELDATPPTSGAYLDKGQTHFMGWTSPEVSHMSNICESVIKSQPAMIGVASPNSKAATKKEIQRDGRNDHAHGNQEKDVDTLTNYMKAVQYCQNFTQNNAKNNLNNCLGLEFFIPLDQFTLKSGHCNDRFYEIFSSRGKKIFNVEKLLDGTGLLLKKTVLEGSVSDEEQAKVYLNQGILKFSKGGLTFL